MSKLETKKKEFAEMHLFEKIKTTFKQILREPFEAAIYEGYEPESRLYQVSRKVRFADMIWTIHGINLRGKEGYIGVIKGIGIFDLLTLLIFRLAIRVMQWSHDTLKSPMKDLKSALGKFELAIQKIVAAPLLFVGFVFHLLGNFVLRPLVTVAIAITCTVIPIFFVAEYWAEKKSKKMTEDMLKDFDRQILEVNNKPVSNKISFSFRKKEKTKEEPLPILEPLLPQLEKEKIPLTNCYIKRCTASSKNLTISEYQICNARDQVVAKYPGNPDTDKAFGVLSPQLFKVSKVQRQKIRADKTNAMHKGASLDRRGHHGLRWF